VARITPDNIEDQLNRFLVDAEPEVATFVKALWADMSKEISSPIAGQMISQRSVPASIIEIWDRQYADFIDGVLSQKWAESMRAGESNLASKWRLLTPANINTWMDNRGPALFDGLITQQSRSLNQMIRFFATEAPLAQDTLASIISPAVGLTEKQSKALTGHFNALTEAGASEDSIRLSMSARASKFQRARADMIARTELASAYNGGIDVAIRQGIDDGVFEGEVQKVWRTQDDERVCPICGPLDETSVDMGDSFSSLGFTGDVPPAHPMCRCVVLYEDQE
jgi:hypothetical protein